MASKDTKRVIELGEWLEVYLNPDINAREYRALINKFIEFYDVDFRLEKDELTIKFFECFDKQDEETKNFYRIIKWWEYFCKEPWKSTCFYSNKYNSLARRLTYLIDDGCDPLMIKSFFRELILNSQDHEVNSKEFSSIESFSKLFTSYYFILVWIHYKELVYNVLKEMVCSKNNSQHILFNALKKHVFLKSLVDNYGKIMFRICIDEKSRSVEPRKKFISMDYYIHNFPENISIFPWDIAIARVFFDFLNLGGQNHILFCKQCGRFAVIQKTGRKKYCSALCRTRASNERIARAGI